MSSEEKDEKGGYKCQQCSKYYSTKRTLVVHQKLHAQNKSPRYPRYACNQCEKVFRKSEHLEMHQIVHIGENPFPSTSTKNPEETKWYEKYLTKNEIKSRNIEYDNLMKTEYGKEDEIEESNTGTDEKQIPDNLEDNKIDVLCGDIEIKEEPVEEHGELIFVREKHYNMDEMEEEADEEISEEEKEESSDEDDDFQPHQEASDDEDYTLSTIQKNDESFECKTCYKKFESQKKLKSHENKHKNEEKTFSCEECRKTFKHRSSLRNHNMIHHSEEGRKQYKSGSKKDPNAPKKAKEKEKKEILCSVCGKSFSKNVGLVIHMRTHTGEKPYQCDVCPRAFSFWKTLRDHRLLHTGEKPYPCTECDMRFVRAYDLKRHKALTHYDPDNPPIKEIITVPPEKKYLCDVCFGRFATSNGLMVHKRSHTGERPFVCEYCQKAFITASDMKVHVRIHTGEKPYKCDGCGNAFRVKPLLTKHEKRCAALNPDL